MLLSFSELAKSLARQAQEFLSGQSLSPVDKLAVLAEYQEEMRPFELTLEMEGRDWVAQQGSTLESSLQTIRYIYL